MNISTVLKKSYDLMFKSSKTYKLDCEVLLANILKKNNRFELLLNKDQVLDQKEIDLFFKQIDDRKKFKPVSKIINKKPFWTFDIDVSKKVLIPRPETEVLIDMVSSKLKNKKKIKFLDIGCGSGCISLSLLDCLKDSKGVAFDISKEAILNTKINLKNYGLEKRLKLFKNDLFKFKTKKKFDLIISNPPYLKLSDYINMEKAIKLFEPKSALVGDDKKGTKFFEKIICNLKGNLKLNGYLAFEIGNNQFNRLKQILILNGFKIEAKYELINRQIRCLIAKKIKNYTLQ